MSPAATAVAPKSEEFIQCKELASMEMVKTNYVYPHMTATAAKNLLLCLYIKNWVSTHGHSPIKYQWRAQIHYKCFI